MEPPFKYLRFPGRGLGAWALSCSVWLLSMLALCQGFRAPTDSLLRGRSALHSVAASPLCLTPHALFALRFVSQNLGIGDEWNKS